MLGAGRLTRLQPADVKRVIADLSRRGASASAVRYTRTVLRTALASAVRDGLLDRNAAAGRLNLPPVDRQHTEPLTPAEARAFLAATADDRLGALWLLALSTGLRRGELLGLQWRDLDLDAGTLVVRRALVQVAGQVSLSEPKTARSVRRLSLADPVVAALRRHQERQEDERAVAGDRWRESGHVFTSSIGTPLDPAAISRLWSAALAQAGVRHVRLHDARHSVASYAIASGASPRLVMELLGHADISTTMNIYAHVFDEAKRETSDGIARVLELGAGSPVR
jgi:integrase